MHGRSHNLDVQVLGIEETWNTPSLLLANNWKSGGKALFSQVIFYLQLYFEIFINILIF